LCYDLRPAHVCSDAPPHIILTQIVLPVCRESLTIRVGKL
jgi:hypothetical protein